MLIFLSLFACEEEKTEPTEEEIPTVEATLHLLSAIDNSNQSEVPIHSELENEERLTEEDGKIPVLVEQSAIYNIHAGTPSTMNHIYQGWSGEEDFELVGYLVDTATTQSVYASLGLELETGKGIVVAALDYPDLAPVYGATAALSLACRLRAVGCLCYQRPSPRRGCDVTLLHCRLCFNRVSPLCTERCAKGCNITVLCRGVLLTIFRDRGNPVT